MDASPLPLTSLYRPQAGNTPAPGNARGICRTRAIQPCKGDTSFGV